MPRPTLASMIAAGLRAQDVAQDQAKEGWLIPYAERLARRRESKPLSMKHLEPAARMFERALSGERVRGLISISVRHGKTTLAQAAILGALRRNPRMRINYASYASDLAEAKMYEVRQLALGEGIKLDPNFQTDAEWRTEQGGAVKAGGLIGGPWNGQGAHLNLVDDPYKNAEQAMSRAFREKTREQFNAPFITRLEPGGSCIGLSARWCPPDLLGELESEGWEVVNLPALWPDDTPLWPERWTVEELHEIRRTNPWWHALYQGSPRPEGSRIFDPAHLVTYTELPTGSYVEALGLDMAYGKKARNDRSSLTVFRRYSAEPRALYLVETWTGREAVELFACRVAEVQLRRRGFVRRLTLPKTAADIEAWRSGLLQEDVLGALRIQARWYTSTTESGVADLMPGYGARVQAKQATVDKLARAQGGGYTAAWAEGRIRVPAREDEHQRAWRVAHEDFTGADGDADDPVDGAVAAHDLLYVPPASLGGGRSVTFGRAEFASREG